MLSYFAEELAEQTSRGVRNDTGRSNIRIRISRPPCDRTLRAALACDPFFIAHDQ
jgi:hypothetical protein